MKSWPERTSNPNIILHWNENINQEDTCGWRWPKLVRGVEVKMDLDHIDKFKWEITRMKLPKTGDEVVEVFIKPKKKF